MRMRIIACCIMAALQPCCFAHGGGGGGGFGGVMGAAFATGPEVTTMGTVFDPSGAPDPNAGLMVWRGSRSIGVAKPGAEGRYSIQWLAPTEQDNAAQIKSTLIVRDQARNFVATRELDETNTRLDLRLREGLSLSGSVQDPGGKPLTGLDVRLVTLVNNWPSALDQASTDAQGAFTFKGLPQEQDYSLYVNFPLSSSGVRTGGYGCGGTTLVAMDARTNHYAFPAVVLKKADHNIAGYVLDGDNKPLAGARLRLSGEGQPTFLSVTTDQQGRFAVDGVCEGPLTISSITFFPPVFDTMGHADAAPKVVTLNAVNGQDIRGGDTNLILKLGAKPPDTNAPQPAL